MQWHSYLWIHIHIHVQICSTKELVIYIYDIGVMEQHFDMQI